MVSNTATVVHDAYDVQTDTDDALEAMITVNVVYSG